MEILIVDRATTAIILISCAVYVDPGVRFSLAKI